MDIEKQVAIINMVNTENNIRVRYDEDGYVLDVVKSWREANLFGAFGVGDTIILPDFIKSVYSIESAARINCKKLVLGKEFKYISSFAFISDKSIELEVNSRHNVEISPYGIDVKESGGINKIVAKKRIKGYREIWDKHCNKTIIYTEEEYDRDFTEKIMVSFKMYRNDENGSDEVGEKSHIKLDIRNGVLVDRSSDTLYIVGNKYGDILKHAIGRFFVGDIVGIGEVREYALKALSNNIKGVCKDIRIYHIKDTV